MSQDLPSKPATVTTPSVKAPKYKSEDYNGAKIVRLRLKSPDTIQYDAGYKLLLNSSAPEGMELPLTPFFASRLGSAIELV